MADQTKLEYFKEKLEEQGLIDVQWQGWLAFAILTLSAVRKVLDKFDPDAALEISALEDTELYLLGLKEELEDGETSDQ